MIGYDLMKKKLLVSVICASALLAGCGNGDTEEISDTSAAEVTEDIEAEETTTTVYETEDTETETEASAETEENGEELHPEIKVLGRDELGVNADGSLSEAFTRRIEELMTYNINYWGINYPSLYDFDYDGIPEIYILTHSGNQGYMSCEVYSAEDLSLLGEFEGFCRDGFTHFSPAKGGTMIHNYFEHSIFSRNEQVLYATLEDGKFETTLLYDRIGNRNDAESYGTMAFTLRDDEEAIKYVNSLPGEYPNFWQDQTLVSYYDGTAFTSYDTDADYGEFAAAAVESYNNYIKYSQLAPRNENDDYYNLVLVGDKNQMAFWQAEDGLYFFGENGDKTLLSSARYYNVYKLWDNIVVCQPFGNAACCDVYMVKDGKPELIKEISGVGMYFDYSRLYNEDFEMVHSVYDGSTIGYHTFKKYHFYFDDEGIHEYGSIVVPKDEFYAEYGDAIADIEAEITGNGYEIYEILYRSNYCFILNCRNPMSPDEYEDTGDGKEYYYYQYSVIKPMTDRTFSVIEQEGGTYLTALCPDIAVYPEKMYLFGD